MDSCEQTLRFNDDWQKAIVIALETLLHNMTFNFL